VSDFGSDTARSGPGFMSGGVGLKSDTGDRGTAVTGEARRLGHHWVGEEHLLLALSRQDGAAGEALRAAGATPERLEQTIVQGVENPTRRSSAAQPTRRP
jgi:ATP-dependent Clp protease ATP-binding subunit ClpC